MGGKDEEGLLVGLWDYGGQARRERKMKKVKEEGDRGRRRNSFKTTHMSLTYLGQMESYSACCYPTLQYI